MKWNRGAIIGRGSFATVSIAQTSQTLLAVKSTPLSISRFLQKEQQFLSTFNSPQIVAYKGFDITTENNIHLYNLFLEYAPSGTLVDFIHNQGGYLPQPMIQFYTKSILLGLNYLHDNGIVHSDIKGQNILIDKQGGAKITDFGCAKLVSEEENIGGTPLFMAPEVARGERQGYPADVWALGCTVVQMATGKPPWSEEFNDPASALYHIGFSDNNIPQIPSFMSEEAKDFLGKCFVKDPSKRWSVSQLLNHHFISKSKSNFTNTNELWNKSSVETPTSVLSESVWEATCCGDSPMERIRKLEFCHQELLRNWEIDVDWVTVRSDETRHEMVSARHPIVVVTHATHMPRWSCQDAICCCNEFSGKWRCNTVITSGHAPSTYACGLAIRFWHLQETI